MNKYMKLLLCGLVPMAAGYLLNFLYYLPIPIFFVNLVLAVLWGYFCFRVADAESSALLQTLLLCVAGLLMLALNLYFVLVKGAYAFNLVGSMCQTYFLPFLSIAAMAVHFAGAFGNAFSTITMAPVFVCSYVIMLVVTFIGVKKKVRKY